MSNGLLWVWWVNGHGQKSDWFLCRVNNGHVLFIECNIKLAASRLMQDNIPFMRVPDRLVAELLGDEKPDELLILLDPPEYGPYFYLRYCPVISNENAYAESRLGNTQGV